MLLPGTCAKTLPRHWPCAAAEFSRKYPEVTLEVHSSFEDVDLLEQNYDLTIRYDKLEDSTMIARRLGGYSLCLCAAPGYWEKLLLIHILRPRIAMHICSASIITATPKTAHSNCLKK